MDEINVTARTLFELMQTSFGDPNATAQIMQAQAFCMMAEQQAMTGWRECDNDSSQGRLAIKDLQESSDQSTVASGKAGPARESARV